MNGNGHEPAATGAEGEAAVRATCAVVLSIGPGGAGFHVAGLPPGENDVERAPTMMDLRAMACALLQYTQAQEIAGMLGAAQQPQRGKNIIAAGVNPMREFVRNRFSRS